MVSLVLKEFFVLVDLVVTRYCLAMSSFYSIRDYLQHVAGVDGHPTCDIEVCTAIFSIMTGHPPLQGNLVAVLLSSSRFLEGNHTKADILEHLDVMAQLDVLTLEEDGYVISDTMHTFVSPLDDDDVDDVTDCVRARDIETQVSGPRYRHPACANYILFNSEHPDQAGYYLSNWYNDRQHAPHAEYWCAEQAFLLRKLRFCANLKLASSVFKQIEAIQPVSTPPFGHPDFDAAWDQNHEKCRRMKELCRNRDLQLLDDLWSANKYDILKAVLREKFCRINRPYAWFCLSGTGTAKLIEASSDDQFGIGMQAGEHYPRNKPNRPSATILVGNIERWRVPPAYWRGTNLLGRALEEIRSVYCVPTARMPPSCTLGPRDCIRDWA